MQSPLEKYKARQADRQRQEQEHAPKPWYWFGQREPIARFTLYIGILTLALVTVGIFQWWIIRGQLAQMRAESRDTHLAARLDQRAWLGVEDIAGEEKIDMPFSAVIHIKNTGKTPAIKVHFGGNAEVSNATPYMGMDCVKAMKNPARVIISPQAGFSIPVRADTWGKLDKYWHQKLGDRLVYIHGCLLYEDIFNESHWLTFCGYWKSDITSFENCETGDDTGDGNNTAQQQSYSVVNSKPN